MAELTSSSALIPFIAHALITYPIRIHFGWTTAAALINWNMFVVSFRQQGLEVFPALFSVWFAASIAAFRANILGYFIVVLFCYICIFLLFVWSFFFTYAFLAVVYVSRVDDIFFNTSRL
jgi:hypothetical protein